MGKSKVRNQTLSIFEAITAYAVVLLHCPFPGKVGQIISAFGNYAVPLFFAISGYFYYSDDIEKSLKSTKRKVFHLFKLLVFTELFYWLWYSAFPLLKYGFKVKILINTLLAQIKGYDVRALWGTAPIFNGALWFVVQLMLVYCVWNLILRLSKKIKFITKIAFIMIPIGVATVNAILSYAKITGSNRSFWYLHWFFFFDAFPYFSLGYFLRRNNERFINIKGIYIFLIGIGIQIIEILLFGKRDTYFGILFIVSGILLISEKKKDCKFNNVLLRFLNKTGEECSTYIYLLHNFVIGLVGYIAYKLPIDDSSLKWSIAKPIIVCFCVTILAFFISVIMRKLNAKKKNTDGV